MRFKMYFALELPYDYLCNTVFFLVLFLYLFQQKKNIDRLHRHCCLFVCKYLLSDFWENLLSWIASFILNIECTMYIAHVYNIVYNACSEISCLHGFSIEWMSCDIAWECILLNLNIYSFFSILWNNVPLLKAVIYCLTANSMHLYLGFDC